MRGTPTCCSRERSPEALKKAKPGTKEFKVALRDALENTKELVATHGVYTMTPTEHNGLDNRARTMIKIENGQWVLAEVSPGAAAIARR